MSHGFTRTDNMAFVGQTPWHSLGNRVTKGATLETWRREANLDWSAIEAPVQFTTADGTVCTMPERKVLYRSDNGAPLAVVGEGYNVFQPAECLEFCRDLTEAGGWHIHTAGTLNGGRKLWVMASNHTEGEVAAGDRVRGNLLIATSLDGTLKTHACMTAIRVVCANTLGLALREGGARAHDGAEKLRNGVHVKRDAGGKVSAVAVSHRSQFNAEEVKQQLGLARNAFEHFMDDARALTEKSVSETMARDLLRDLIGKPTARAIAKAAATVQGDVTPAEVLAANPALASGASPDFLALLAKDKAGDAVREHRNVARVLELYKGAGMGSQHVASRGTAWGLLNAVTQFVDHESARTDDSRLASAWFGRGNDLKQSAFNALMAL